MGTLGISHFSKKQWIWVIEWIAPEVQKVHRQSRNWYRRTVCQGPETVSSIKFIFSQAIKES